MKTIALILLSALSASPALAQEAVLPAMPAPLAREAAFRPDLAPAVPASSENISPLPAEELDASRGGFLVAGELAFEFGAVVRTFKDGVLAMQTEVNWSEAGPVITRMADDALSGVVGGASQVLQRVDNGQLTNILINSENNHSFRQDTDITLTLPGFAATQLNIGGALAAQRLTDDLAVGSVGALR